MNDLSKEKTQESVVLRILYHVLFYFVYSITELILLVVMCAQLLVVLVTKEPSASLQFFSASMGIYSRQIWSYIGFHSDEKPFPFSDWPEQDEVSK